MTERPWMDQKTRRLLFSCWVLGHSLNYGWYICGRVKTAHPDSLPPGSPLLYPLLPLQVLLPPICKISILYFLNRQGRETQGNGLYCATGSEASTVCFFKFTEERGDVMWKRKLKGFDWSMLPFIRRLGFFSSTFIDNHVSVSLVLFRG